MKRPLYHRSNEAEISTMSSWQKNKEGKKKQEDFGAPTREWVRTLATCNRECASAVKGVLGSLDCSNELHEFLEA